MKLKQLESLLSEVGGFESPSTELEQIATNAHLAAHFLLAAHQRGDVYHHTHMSIALTTSTIMCMCLHHV